MKKEKPHAVILLKNVNTIKVYPGDKLRGKKFTHFIIDDPLTHGMKSA